MKRRRAVAPVILILAATGLTGSRVRAVDGATRDNLRLFTELVSVEHERYGAPTTYRDLIGTAMPKKAGPSSAKGVEYRP